MDFGKEDWRLKQKPLLAGNGGYFRGTTPLRQSNRVNLNAPFGGFQRAASTLPSEFSWKCNHLLPGGSASISHAEKLSANGSSQVVPQTPMASNVVCGSSKKSAANMGGNPSVPRILSRKIDKELMHSLLKRGEARARARLALMDQENEERYSLRHSTRKYRLLLTQGSNKRQPRSFITQDRNVLCEDKTSNPNQEQECCRALSFDDVKEMSDDEVTQPLDMMDMTAMISGASVFQDPKICKRTKNPQSQRKDLLDRASKCENPIKKREKFDNCFEDIENHFKCSEEVALNNITLKKAIPSRIPPPKITINETKTAENIICKQTNKSRIQKRRSAIPTFKVTPKYKIKRDLRSKSTSKLRIPSESEHYQKGPIQRSSKPESRCSCRNISRRSAVIKIPKIVVEDDAKSSKCDVAVSTESVEKCDAATNTSMQYIYGESLKSDLVREVQKLNEDIDEIKRKADLINEQTVARRKKMNESHVLEDFLTSISPLKRIHAMLHENESSLAAGEALSCSRVSTVSETNVASGSSRESVCLDDCDMDLTNPNCTTVDDSIIDQSGFNTTGDLNVSHSKWKHLRLNSRVFQTQSSHPKKEEILLTSPPENEHFDGNLEDSVSPFTEMAGDCERPSLAPMTPHSHKQVSMLKLSLRKQLDQLYE